MNTQAYDDFELSIKDADQLWEFYEKERIYPRHYASYSGIVIPAIDVEIRSKILHAGEDKIVVVVDQYPCEKCYVEAYWVALNVLVDCDDIVEIFTKEV